MRRFFPLLCLCVLLTGCSLNEDRGPELLPLDVLLTAPDTLLLGDQHIVMSFTLPNSTGFDPPNSTFWISTVDMTNLPNGLDADVVWLINDETVWAGYLRRMQPRPFGLFLILDSRPDWDPEEAIVRLRYQDETHLLRGSPLPTWEF